MALTTYNITHTIFDAGGVELPSFISHAVLSNNESDTVNKHVRISGQPLLEFTATIGGINTLVLPTNINNSFYTVSSYPEGTTEFLPTNEIDSGKIRVGVSDAEFVDIQI